MLVSNLITSIIRGHTDFRHLDDQDVVLCGVRGPQRLRLFVCAVMLTFVDVV